MFLNHHQAPPDVDRAEPIAIEGAHITCPECGAAIGTLRKTIRQNFTFGLDAIRFEPHQGPINGQAICNVCHASWAEMDITLSGSQMLVHTCFGWLPRPPPNVKPPERPPIRTPGLPKR